jgi:hypothetical protein
VRRVLLRSLAVVIILAATIWAIGALRVHLTFGTKIDESDLTVTVDEGDRFSLAVPDRGASVGDSWSAAATPDGVLQAVDNRKVMSNLADRLFGPEMGGGGGTRYFVFEARKQGTARVVVTNCFRGCDNENTRRFARSVTWTITVD